MHLIFPYISTGHLLREDSIQLKQKKKKKGVVDAAVTAAGAAADAPARPAQTSQPLPGV